MRQWYGPTSRKKSNSEGDERFPLVPGDQYLHPPPSELENNGGATVYTNESEPLLGERWLLCNEDTDDDSEKVKNHSDSSIYGGKLGEETSSSKSFYTDCNTVDIDVSDNGFLKDSRIGISVYADSEVGTLSYSRDLDDCTLITNDRSTPGVNGKIIPLKIVEGDEDEEDSINQTDVVSREKALHGNQEYFLVCFGLAVGIALCAVAGLAYIEYWHNHVITVIPDSDENTSKSSGSNNGGELLENISGDDSSNFFFSKISRTAFHDPVSDIFDVSLFHPSLLYLENAKRAIEEENITQPFFKFPFPTGAFWTNLVMQPVKREQPDSISESKNNENENQYSYPIVAYPYSFQWSSLGKLQASYSAFRRIIETDRIQDAFAPDMTLGSVEEIRTRHVVKFDNLSVSLRFNTNTQDPIDNNDVGFREDNDRFWEVYIVQGSPYITIRYNGLTPQLTALSDFEDITCPGAMDYTTDLKLSMNTTRERILRSTYSATGTDTAKMLGICDVSDDSTQNIKIISGVQFVVTTVEFLTWIVFASEPITFELRRDARHSILGKDVYVGIIRVALVPPLSSSSASRVAKSLDVDHFSSSPGVKRLIYHAEAYPVGGKVTWSYRSGKRNPLVSAIASSNNSQRKLFSLDGFRGIPSKTMMEENNIGIVTFEFDTKQMTNSAPNSRVPLLMLSLPHHVALMSSAEAMLLQPKEFDLVYRSIKGRMIPIIGSEWSYEEDLMPNGFMNEFLNTFSSEPKVFTNLSNDHQTTSKLNISANINPLVRKLILQNVEVDLKLNLPEFTNGAYGFGKQIARLAQLAHVAEILEGLNGSNSSENISDILSSTTDSVMPSNVSQKAYELLEMYLKTWLVGDGNGKLFYDANLGGIISKKGMENVLADFGNGRYNDHHFHYGYTLYASAILGRKNPQFVSDYGALVDSIFYDVAHNSNDFIKSHRINSIFFPFARHKSWFDGHSFASGLFPFANGKSQESSSEAVNCYFGAYLWSTVRWGRNVGSSREVDFSRLLLAMELTGAKFYWHMLPPAENDANSNSTKATSPWSTPIIYNALFAKNYMVGNLGMTDVTSTTWFGTEKIYVHLINFMPVTVITSELFQKEYVEKERMVLTDDLLVESSWKGYDICHKAILDPNGAWRDAQDLLNSQLDPGLSKSLVLYWVSTREDFSSFSAVIDVPAGVVSNHFIKTSSSGEFGAKNSSVTAESRQNENNSSCQSHEACSTLGLHGLCCPTNDGVYLSCCN